MKKIGLPLLALCMLLLTCGCTNYWYDLPSDFIDASSYSAKIGDTGLGHVEDILTNVYALEGLSKNEYLGITRGSLWDTGLKEDRALLIMSKNVQEPVFRYDVYEIKIERVKVNFDRTSTTVEDPVVIQDSEVIANLISLHAEGKGKSEDDFGIDPNSYYSNLFTFHFDLPCELIWRSYIFQDEDENRNEIVYWKCYRAVDHQAYYYDVTEILSPFLS